MNKNIYIRDEFLQRAGIDRETLQQWEEKKLIKPLGFTDDQSPFYSEATSERAEHIKKLIELGYELEEIYKIVKKIGLPRSGAQHQDQKKLDQYLTVGTLAERVGVSPRTIKHWEDKGIIEPDMRSEGGFRLYSETSIYLCQLIKDLQLFGYSLEQIQTLSAYFRDFLAIQDNPVLYSIEETREKLQQMQKELDTLFDKIDSFRQGIERWEDLLKKKRKELTGIKGMNEKRQDER